MKHLLINRSLPFLLSKLISFSLLYGFTALLPTVEYYNRFIPVAIFATILSNSLIPFEIFRFTFGRIYFIRNLPYRRFKVYLQTWLVMIILLLPEIVFTYRNFASFAGLMSITTHLMAAMAFLSFIFAGLLVYRWAQESLITKIFLAFLFIVLYLIFDLPSVLLFVVFLLGSYLIFYQWYYRYEPVYTGGAD